ncbi:MAG TPA: NAD-dependent epimerase/dehydratase family protein [Candidatus Nitrosotalea sp.]|nr:NAD-dependent epimerase/dehydratase family protein [Candidatus Nitrosotalea sp.]
MMNYVITGGAGFIGSHLAKALLEKGHSVKIIDNLSTGTKSNLDGILEKISFHGIDVLDYKSLEKVLQGSQGIFHLAALTSVPESYLKQKEYHDVNVLGTENIFQIAKKFHIKTVFASSSSVYGNTKNIPTPESEKRDPINPYGITKLEAEDLALQYSKHCDIVGLRYYNVYGQDMIAGTGVITQFYQNIQRQKPPVIDGDGGQLRDFVHIDDVVRATISAMEKDTGSTFINIGTGTATSILQLANMFIKYSGLDTKPVSVNEKEGNVRASQADVSLAKRLLDWKPQTKLEDWIESLYKS